MRLYVRFDPKPYILEQKKYNETKWNRVITCSRSRRDKCQRTTPTRRKGIAIENKSEITFWFLLHECMRMAFFYCSYGDARNENRWPILCHSSFEKRPSIMTEMKSHLVVTQRHFIQCFIARTSARNQAIITFLQ